ncbi:MAG: class I SAM-dependent methyltransferase [Acidobacteriia bacterium]|nr:class I SAM-dependent methyltransferase [Terriglobia bacterium]
MHKSSLGSADQIEFNSARTVNGKARPVLVAIFLVPLCCVGQRIISLAQTAQQHHPPESTTEYIRALEDPGRDSWQQPDLVVQDLGLHEGDEIADLGAGSGYFTVRLAREVGPAGKVYAVDVDPQMLSYIEQRAQKEKLDNIQTILADPNDPKLGSESVDLIFVCDVLHHIQDRGKYYPKLFRALRFGGRLVNVDFQKRELPIGPPVEMKIDKKECIKEIKAGGFGFRREFEFLKYQYFLVFEKQE